MERISINLYAHGTSITVEREPNGITTTLEEFVSADGATIEHGTATARFVKLDATGAELPDSAPEWAAVLDTQHRVIWAAKDAGEPVDWATAKAQAEALTICGAPARLPTVRELQSLVDFDRCDPAIDGTFFRGTQSRAYWSSSAFVGNSDYAWFVYFYDGDADWNHRDDLACVRAVRSVSAPAAGQ